jgi:polyhydroxybutyrate depolymerase
MINLCRLRDWILPELICLDPMAATAHYLAVAEIGTPRKSWCARPQIGGIGLDTKEAALLHWPTRPSAPTGPESELEACRERNESRGFPDSTPMRSLDTVAINAQEGNAMCKTVTSEVRVLRLLNPTRRGRMFLKLIRNRFVLLVSVFLSICVASCGGSAATPKANPTPSSGVQHASLTVGGVKRTYRLYIPASLDRNHPAPLVVALTACPTTGDVMAEVTHLDDQAATGGFIVVYPDPVGGCWNTGTCCGNADDFTFISRLLNRMTTDLRIDKARIFAAGIDAGAIMAYSLACKLSDRIAAIASVSGREDLQDCKPARMVSVLAMHGTDDAHVPYTLGANAVQRWVTLDGCRGNPTQSESGITKTSIWSNCQGGTVVRFDTVVGGHHTWFGSTFDPVPGEPNSNAVIWDFFSKLAPRA